MVQVSDHTALLSGATVNGVTGIGAFVSFAFPTGVPAYLSEYYSAEGLATFRAYTDAEKVAARSALDAWAAVSGLTFFEVAPGEGDINFMVFDMAAVGAAGAAGFGYYPDSGYGQPLASDIFMSSGAAGSRRVLLHEIGHAIGLKHSFEDDITLAPEFDTVQHTVMSYISGGFSGTELGLLDDDAVAALYGDATHKGGGAATWSWDLGTRTLSQDGGVGTDALYGIGGADVIRGGAGDDALYGKGGADRLYGEDGADQLQGGFGDDVLDGGDGDDELTDYDGANRLYGGEGADRLVAGSAGDDLLDGGDGDDMLQTSEGGADTLYGGEGDDRLRIFLDAGGSFTADGGEGLDRATVIAIDDTPRRISVAELLAEIEIVSITGGDGADVIAVDAPLLSATVDGGGGDDVIRIGEGAGSAQGGDGDDVIHAGAGATFLSGGTGADLFVFESVSASTAAAQDQIGDFETGVDTIDLTGFGAANVRITAASGGSVVHATGPGGAAFQLFVRGEVQLSDVRAQAVATYGGAGADALAGGSGGDALYGLAGDDTLDGGAAADTLVGGVGNDIFYVDAAGDSVIEAAGEGDDRVFASVSYTLGAGASVETVSTRDIAGTQAIDLVGNELANTLVGNAGANSLNGGGGADVLLGFGGNDLLIGGEGAANTLQGGAGDDSYYVSAAGDSVIEFAGEGVDTVRTVLGQYVLGGNLENLVFIGTGGFVGVGDAGANVIVGAGGGDILNGQAGADILVGFAGDDILIGGAGAANTLQGGLGNDTYYVSAAGDSIVEGAGEGYDTVITDISSATIAANVEALVYNGSGAFIGVGGGAADVIVGAAGGDELYGRGGADILSGAGGADLLFGGEGADQLNGGAGNDRLTGGEGADLFVFADAGVDTITDFAGGVDRILLDRALFAGLAAGALAAGAFVRGGVALDADDRILYNPDTGALLYDADGSGAGAAVQIGVVSVPTGVLGAGDFVVV